MIFSFKPILIFLYRQLLLNQGKFYFFAVHINEECKYSNLKILKEFLDYKNSSQM